MPANVTVVREGAGEFFATQGDDKCAVDELTQDPSPATTVDTGCPVVATARSPRAPSATTGAVLVSEFDVDAVVEYPRSP